MRNILSIDGICKSFSGIQVLKDVSLELEAGQIICLAGENGAGKSTLIKILSGAEKPDKGKITIFGTTYERMTPGQAMHLGIATIYQDADLVSSLTVSDNIFLGNERLRGRAFVNSREQEERTRRLLQSLSMDMKPSMLVEELSPGQKQNLQIAKALYQEARILIMDEPTASLGEEETASLMNLVEQLRKKGLGIIYISHYLEEMFRLGDMAYVLKDGAMVKKLMLKETNQDELIKAMVGRDASNFYQKGSFSSGDRALVAEHYSGNRIVRDVSFSVSRGEVFGLGGLVGAGRTELVRMIYGADKKDSGTLSLDGKDITPTNPKSAVKRGVFLVSEDRKGEGLFLIRSARENLTISKNDNSFFLNLRKEKGIVDKSIQQLKIKVFSQEQEVGNLSGGNQQKVVISRWLLEDGDVYIFDEPTKGVDVGAREEIYKLIEKLAKEQKIVIMVSSNMPELISMSDRIGVMREGRLVRILDSADVTEDGLIKEYIGVKE
ncbi:sugar ABC transporter ATP-binding protein [Enterocloster clostridioformis]|uniref:sugar ABC transporter ATP-binding protein n=1 Tax=Enterocloster clostridioformis TaxID=1531 RepID=UPI002675BB18|nr:sugar ABC transporter ATP-binding protein [Enterocloster clostridioformis]